MAAGREEEIKARAYDIWEREGRPAGREREHWDQARREIEAEQAAAAVPAEPKRRKAAQASTPTEGGSSTSTARKTAKKPAGSGKNGEPPAPGEKRPRRSTRDKAQ